VWGFLALSRKGKRGYFDVKSGLIEVWTKKGFPDTAEVGKALQSGNAGAVLGL